jgi:uncharacterized membrane protein HdeD (DUF308 family)
MALFFRQTVVAAGDIGALRANIEHEISRHRGWYIFQGFLFLFFGVLAAALPGVTALSVTLIVGALLLISGIFQLVLSYKARMHGWAIASAALSIIAGGLILWSPFAGLLAVVALIAVFLTIEGITELMLASAMRPLRGWGWLLFSGVIALVLAAVIWLGFPEFGVLYLGWVVAINLMLFGF